MCDLYAIEKETLFTRFVEESFMVKKCRFYPLTDSFRLTMGDGFIFETRSPEQLWNIAKGEAVRI